MRWLKKIFRKKIKRTVTKRSTFFDSKEITETVTRGFIIITALGPRACFRVARVWCNVRCDVTIMAAIFVSGPFSAGIKPEKKAWKFRLKTNSTRTRGCSTRRSSGVLLFSKILFPQFRKPRWLQQPLRCVFHRLQLNSDNTTTGSARERENSFTRVSHRC